MHWLDNFNRRNTLQGLKVPQCRDPTPLTAGPLVFVRITPGVVIGICKTKVELGCLLSFVSMSFISGTFGTSRLQPNVILVVLIGIRPPRFRLWAKMIAVHVDASII